MIAFVDKRVTEIELGGHRSFAALLGTAYPHLRRTGNLPRGLHIGDANVPSYFIAKMFEWFPTHEEIFESEETKRYHLERLMKFFSVPTDAANQLLVERERAAAMLLILICAVITQAGVFDTTSGAPLDHIASFHLANGARYVSVPPMMSSRPRDLAAWLIGQILEYPIEGAEAWDLARNVHIGERAVRLAWWTETRTSNALDMSDWRIIEADVDVGTAEPSVAIDIACATEYLTGKLESIAALAFGLSA